MKRAVKKATTEESGSQPVWDWTIGLQLMDTAWRVAVPILVFTLGGIWLDKHFVSKPLFTLIGLFLSLAVAALLVYRQVKAAYPTFFRKDQK